MVSSKTSVNDIDRGYDFVAVEREKHGKEHIQPVQLMITQHQKGFFRDGIGTLSHARIMILDLKMTVR